MENIDQLTNKTTKKIHNLDIQYLDLLYSKLHDFYLAQEFEQCFMASFH